MRWNLLTLHAWPSQHNVPIKKKREDWDINIHHQVVNVTWSQTSESQQEVQPRHSSEDKSWPPLRKSTVESHQSISRCQQIPSCTSRTSVRQVHIVISIPAYLVNNQRLRTNSRKQDGRDFNHRGGERGRQPISSRSCEHTDQKVAQVARARQLIDVKTKFMVIRLQVNRNRARWIRLRCKVVQSQDDGSEQRRQARRSKAVIAKAISEATKSEEKTSVEAQSYTATVLEGSDDKLPSRMSSPTEWAKSQYAEEEDDSSRTWKRLKGIMQRTEKVEAMTTTMRVTRMRPRSPRPVRNLQKSRRDKETDVSWSPSWMMNFPSSEIWGREMMMIMKWRSREHQSSTMRNTSQRKVAGSQSRSIEGTDADLQQRQVDGMVISGNNDPNSWSLAKLLQPYQRSISTWRPRGTRTWFSPCGTSEART